jgi:hypothetical protein
MFAPVITTDNNTTRFSANPNTPTNYSGYEIAASNGGMYQAQINVTQNLLNKNRFEAFADQANVAGQINLNNVKLTGHDLEKIVTDQYILCLQDRKQFDYALSMVQLMEEQKNMVNKLVENGLLKQSDITLLNIESSGYAGQLATFNAVYRRDLMDLNVLCGINDTALVILENINLQLNPTTDKSNYLEKYRLDSLNLVSIQKISETKYKPQLNYFANAGLNAVYAPTILNRMGVSAGLNFIWNFYDGKQKLFTRNKTDYYLKTISSYRDNFNMQNTVRKNKIQTELISYTSRLEISRKQLSDYENLLQSYKKEIVLGQLSVINYVNVLKNVALVQRDVLLMESNRLLLINSYNYWNW